MYTEVGAFDAKAKLSELLREVGKGRHFTITLRGEPVADLVPTSDFGTRHAQQAINDMKAIKKITGVSSADISSWISEGRR